MAFGDVPINAVGNLARDPELRFTPSGAAVANFTLACTPRFLDKASCEWKDGETTWLNCNIWRTAAENLANSLKRGDRVMIQGRLRQRSYETKEGEKRTATEVEVDEIGPSMKFHPATVNRPDRSGGQQEQRGSAPQDDPWGSAPASKPSSGGFADDPPF